MSGRRPPLIWEKPAICWAPGDPSSLPCQLHTMEFLGTAAAKVLYLHWARQRGKVGAIGIWGPWGSPHPVPMSTLSHGHSPHFSILPLHSTPGGPGAGCNLPGTSEQLCCPQQQQCSEPTNIRKINRWGFMLVTRSHLREMLRTILPHLPGGESVTQIKHRSLDRKPLSPIREGTVT